MCVRVCVGVGGQGGEHGTLEGRRSRPQTGTRRGLRSESARGRKEKPASLC